MGTHQPPTIVRQLPQQEDQTRTRIAHLSYDDGNTSLCGTPINGNPARPGQGRCTVCLDLATLHRHHTR